MAECGIMTDGTDIYVNQYIPTRVHCGNTIFRISSGYTDGGKVSLIVRHGTVGTTLHLRVPSWSPSIHVSIDGNVLPLSVIDGYVSLALPTADCHIQLAFDMTTHVIDLPDAHITLPDGDYHKYRWCDGGQGLCSLGQMLTHPASVLWRGPLLLARSKRIGNTKEEMFDHASVFGKQATAEARVFRHDHMLTACHVTLSYDDRNVETVFCDYASAANRDLDDPWYFSIYM